MKVQLFWLITLHLMQHTKGVRLSPTSQSRDPIQKKKKITLGFRFYSNYYYSAGRCCLEES